MLPDLNPTYTKIDAKSFYLSKTTSTQYNVDSIHQQIKNLDARKAQLLAMLADAATAGVDISAPIEVAQL